MLQQANSAQLRAGTDLDNRSCLLAAMLAKSLIRLAPGSATTVWQPDDALGQTRHGLQQINNLPTGAGEGNRTLVCSLGSCRSTIELHPRDNIILA